MKKPKFPIWNIITVLIITLFALGFYLNGKLNLNFTWEHDWLKVIGVVMIFFWSCLQAGIECNKISEYIKTIEKMRSDTNHALYEYLREYLIRYKDSEKPRLDFFKKALLIKLVHLNTNKPMSIVTIELCKNISEDERNRIVELNMLIDHWIEEFIEADKEKRKKDNYRIESTERPIGVSDEDQFNTISFLLTNVCFENINQDKLQKL